MSSSIQESTNTERVTEDTVYKRVETFVTHTVFTDPFYFHCFFAYVALVTCCHLMRSYSDGKQAWVKYVASNDKPNNNDAFEAASNEIIFKGWRNIWESIMCPYMFMSYIIPYVIMYFNKIPDMPVINPIDNQLSKPNEDGEPDMQVINPMDNQLSKANEQEHKEEEEEEDDKEDDKEEDKEEDKEKDKDEEENDKEEEEDE